MMNGKYKCVYSGGSLMTTVGKIYDFIEGITTWDDSSGSRPYYSLKHFNDNCVSRFEKVEDKIVTKSPKELLEHLDIVTMEDSDKYIFIKVENDESYFTSLSSTKISYWCNFNDDLTNKLLENRTISKITSQSGVVKWERESENDIKIREIESKIVEINEKYLEDIDYYTTALAILRAKNGRFYSEQEAKDMGVIDLDEVIDNYTEPTQSRREVLEKYLDKYIKQVENREIYNHGYPESRLVPSNHFESCNDSFIEFVVEEVGKDIESILRDVIIDVAGNCYEDDY